MASGEIKLLINEYDIIAGTTRLLEDLQYNGFDPALEREKILRIIQDADISRLVTAYVQLGNNIRRAVGRVRVQHNELLNLLSAADSSLARIGICFMPMTYTIRKMGIAKGLVSSRFNNIRVRSELQDVAFQGWQGDNIKEFLIKFSEALEPTRKELKSNVSIDDWILIACNGFSKDKSVSSVMKEDLSIEEALKWLKTEREKVEEKDKAGLGSKATLVEMPSTRKKKP